MTRARLAGYAGALLAAAMVVTACSGGSSDSSALAPSGTLVTDTFTGTVQPGGVDFHTFTVTTGGTVSITLLTAGPPATITMGLAIGTPSSTGTCALLSGGSTLATAGSTAQLTGTLGAGSYCVEVVDVGNAAGPIAYSLTAAHT